MKIIKRLAFLITTLILICIIGIAIYQNMNKKALCGYYSSEYDYDINTYGYLELKEDGTFSYPISVDMSVAIYGEYRIEGDFVPYDLAKQGDIYKWNTERKYTEDYRKEQKIQSFIKHMLIVLVLVAVTGACEVIYKRNRRRLLSGFYYNKKRTECIQIKEDGTYSYVITAEGLQVCGRYSVDKHCLTLISEDSNAYKFEILYKGLKFIEGDDMTDRRLKKNERYRWSAERK